MAFSTITVQALSKRNAFSEVAAFSGITTALTADNSVYGAKFTMNARDDKYLILVQNTAASGSDKTVTVKAGNGIESGKDLVKSDLGYGEYALLCIDSGRYKNVSGTDKGKVIITGTDDNVKVAVFRLA